VLSHGGFRVLIKSLGQLDVDLARSYLMLDVNLIILLVCRRIYLLHRVALIALDSLLGVNIYV